MATLLNEINDLNFLRDAVEKLWQLLDDIDTADDIAKTNDDWYRQAVRNIHAKRFDVLQSDGYNLFMPQAQPNNALASEPAD